MAQFKQDQYDRAMRNNNALEYVQRQGYELVKEGQYYHLKEHDSLVFSPQGSWFWNSRGMSGKAIDFIRDYEGRSFAEAILILAGDSSQPPSHPDPALVPKAAAAHRHTPFVLPEKSPENKRLYGYLCRTRGISYEIVTEMIRQGIVYESIFRKGGKELHNACFVSLDRNGKARSAFQRGITTDSTYKGEIPGGDKRFGWLLRGKHPNRLYVFEAAIDAASYVSLLHRRGADPLLDADFLALGGLSLEPVNRYLLEHPRIDTVHLMLDNDEWGINAAKRFRLELEQKGIHVHLQLPDTGKDWNDTLRHEVEILPPKIHR